MKLLGFKLNGKIYKSLFKKDGNNYIAEVHKCKVRVSQISSIGGELTLTLPLEIEVEDFWCLKDA
jgi:hypothetical protein